MPTEIITDSGEHYLVMNPTDDEIRTIMEENVIEFLNDFNQMLHINFSRVLNRLYNLGRHDELKQLLEHFTRMYIERAVPEYARHIKRIEVRDIHKVLITFDGDLINTERPKVRKRINDQEFIGHPIELLINVTYGDREHPDRVRLKIDTRYINNTVRMNIIRETSIDASVTDTGHGYVLTIIFAAREAASLLEKYYDELVMGKRVAELLGYVASNDTMGAFIN